MKTIEVLHLRLAGEEHGALVDAIRRSVESDDSPIDVRIFGHATLATDLAVHLHREETAHPTRPSDLGVRLAALLRTYGMVEHSVWRQLDSAPSERRRATAPSRPESRGAPDDLP